MLNSTRRPSPALIVSVIALVMALAGSAVALPGKGTIDKNDLKRGVVKSKTIKKNAVKSKHVGADKLKGVDVDEASLGTVPSAAVAADSAAVGGVRFARIQPFTLTDGEEQEILTEGPFTFTAECRINDGGDDFAEILIDTSANNTAFDGQEEIADFDAGDDPEVLAGADAPTGDPEFDADTTGTAIAPDGTEIVFSELYTGVNVVNQAETCRFGGFFGVG